MLQTTTSKANISFLTVLRFASHYWFKQPWMLAIVLILVTAASIIETYLPTTLSTLLKAIREQDSHQAIIFYLIIFLGTYFSQAILFAINYFIYNVFETKIFKMLVDDAFAHVYYLPDNFFANTFSGSIISKINRARQKIEVFEDQIILRIIPTFIIIGGTIFFLALHFKALALLLTLYLFILLIISSILVFKISGPSQEKYAEAQDYFSAHLADSVSGIATAKAYAQEKKETTRFFEITTYLRDKNKRAYIYGTFAAVIQRMLLIGMLVILMGGGVYYLFQGKASVESMAYLVLAYTIIQSYIRELGENIKNLLTSSYDLHAIIKLLQEPTEVEVKENLPALKVTRGEIRFNHISFTYPSKNHPIFNDFSVTIRPGERVALVGHSGSGKTTFIRLLQCLYRLQQGSIELDGQDISQHSLHSLRSSMSLVPQDPILFHRSLRENIAYGKPNATFEEIQIATQKAHIADFIDTLPLQYDTLVGERGIKLSGGERQRVAIARAILADRPILILDEATSSLDSASEKAIQSALYTLTHGRTSIMIAHRLSTILDADRILVFDQGKIVEEGTHEELVNKTRGLYAEFFKLQSIQTI